jgi:hypothetical protein
MNKDFDEKGLSIDSSVQAMVIPLHCRDGIFVAKCIYDGRL